MRLCVAFATSFLTLIAAATSDAQKSSVPPLDPAMGVAVAHSPASSKRYVTTPAIEILPDGSYLIAHQGLGATDVYHSTDRGKSWKLISRLKPLGWAGFFIHGDKLYMMGTQGGFSPLLIYRSEDWGKTWTQPVDSKTGLIRDGSWHTSSMPMIEYKGRIYRGIDFHYSDTRRDMSPCLFSIDADADLLDASNWYNTEPLPRPSEDEVGFKWGNWFEAGAVIFPSGKPGLIIRCDYREGGNEKAVLIEAVDEKGTALNFDPKRDFINFPGGCKKFNVLYDEKSGLYWTLSNFVPRKHWDYNPERARNTLVLMRSKDLRIWEARCAVLYGPDIDHHGFHYADFRFDGDDMIAAIRTAYDDGMGGAHSQHDANYLLFKRIANFRNLEPDDSVQSWLGRELRLWNFHKAR